MVSQMTQLIYILWGKVENLELRRQMRIEVAKRNSEEKTNILNARQSDNTLFHRLGCKQRSQNQKVLDDLKVGQEIVCQEETLNGWYEQLKKIATNRFDMNFIKVVEKDVSVIYDLCLDSQYD